MKLRFVPFVLLPLAWLIACSSDSPPPPTSTGVGGATSVPTASGGSTAVAEGGATAAPITAPTKVREIKVETIVEAGTEEEGSAVIGNLLDPNNPDPLWDPDDPCMRAWIWRDATEADIVAGTEKDLVLYEGKVYRWVGKDPMHYAQSICTPVTTTEWCALCWEPTDIECPDVQLGMTEDTTGQGGVSGLGTVVGPAKGSGGAGPGGTLVAIGLGGSTAK